MNLLMAMSFDNRFRFIDTFYVICTLLRGCHWEKNYIYSLVQVSFFVFFKVIFIQEVNRLGSFILSGAYMLLAPEGRFCIIAIYRQLASTRQSQS